MSSRFIARISFGLIVSLCLAFVSTAAGGTFTQYSFEGDLLDTASGGATADNLTAYQTSGTLATSYRPGIVGQAVRVSRDAGEATVLQATDSADLDLPTNWTLEAFVQPDSANATEWDRFATKWFDGGTAEFHWAFRYGNNGQDLYVNGAPAINGGETGSVPLERWSHVAMTGDSTDAAAGLKLWQNGLVVGTAAYQAVNAGGNAFRIGNKTAAAGDASSQFTGLVDEFTMHDEAKDGAYLRSRSAMMPSAVGFENADHSMAASDFGIVYLNASGDIMRWDGSARMPFVEIAGANAARVVAGDIDGDGAEIIYVDSGNNSSLVTYDVATGTAIDRGGSTISDITAGDFYGNHRDVVNVVNTGGIMYFWTLAKGYGGPVNDAGSRAHQVYSGELDSAHDGSEFIGVYTPWNSAVANNMRIISEDATSALTFTGIGGSGVDEVAAGNIYNNGGQNEVVLTNTGGDVFLWESGFVAIHDDADGAATQLSVGDIDGNGIDEVYWINADDNLLYQYVDGVGESLFDASLNAEWSKMMTADLNGDGFDELYGLKLGDYKHVWFYSAELGGFHTVPEPSTAVLLMMALCAVGFIARRR